VFRATDLRELGSRQPFVDNRFKPGEVDTRTWQAAGRRGRIALQCEFSEVFLTLLTGISRFREIPDGPFVGEVEVAISHAARLLDRSPQRQARESQLNSLLALAGFDPGRRTLRFCFDAVRAKKQSGWLVEPAPDCAPWGILFDVYWFGMRG